MTQLDDGKEQTYDDVQEFNDQDCEQSDNPDDITSDMEFENTKNKANRNIALLQRGVRNKFFK